MCLQEDFKIRKNACCRLRATDFQCGSRILRRTFKQSIFGLLNKVGAEQPFYFCLI